MPGRKEQPEGEPLFGLEAYTVEPVEPVARGKKVHERIGSDGKLHSGKGDVTWHRTKTGAPETLPRSPARWIDLTQKD